MKETCELVKALYRLYITDELGMESQQVVQNHMSECPECVKAYEDMLSKEASKIPQNTCPQKEEALPIKILPLIIAIVFVFVVLAVLVFGILPAGGYKNVKTITVTNFADSVALTLDVKAMVPRDDPLAEYNLQFKTKRTIGELYDVLSKDDQIRSIQTYYTPLGFSLVMEITAANNRRCYFAIRQQDYYEGKNIYVFSGCQVKLSNSTYIPFPIHLVSDKRIFQEVNPVINLGAEYECAPVIFQNNTLNAYDEIFDFYNCNESCTAVKDADKKAIRLIAADKSTYLIRFSSIGEQTYFILSRDS